MTYRYSVLRFQPSLRDEVRAEPLAVVVQGPANEPQSVFVVGSFPDDLDGVSEIGQAVVERLPAIIQSNLNEAMEENVDDLLGFLSERHAWNLHFTPPEEIETNAGTGEVAFQLFAHHVLGLGEDQIPAIQGLRQASLFYEELPVRRQVARV